MKNETSEILKKAEDEHKQSLLRIYENDKLQLKISKKEWIHSKAIVHLYFIYRTKNY